MMSPNLIFCKIVCLIWKRTFEWSTKQWWNIPRKVTIRWSVRSIWSGYFSTCEEKYGICVRRSVEYSSGNLLPCIFFIKYKSMPPIIVTIITLPMKKYGLGLQKPVTSADENFQSCIFQLRSWLEPRWEKASFQLPINFGRLRGKLLKKKWLMSALPN